ALRWPAADRAAVCDHSVVVLAREIIPRQHAPEDALLQLLTLLGHPRRVLRLPAIPLPLQFALSWAAALDPNLLRVRCSPPSCVLPMIRSLSFRKLVGSCHPTSLGSQLPMSECVLKVQPRRTFRLREHVG